MPKGRFLSTYISVQFFIVLILVVSYLNIQKKDMYYLHNPNIIKLCEEQITISEEVFNGLLNILIFTGSRKGNEIAEVMNKMNIWKEKQNDLAEAIKESDVDNDKKIIISDAFRRSNNSISNTSVTFQVIVQKSDVSNLSKSFHDLILKNKSVYINNIKKIIETYRLIDELLVKSARTKERIVFAFAILLVMVNIVILLSPIRRYIIGN
jgi:hypothetical protein